MEPLNLIKPVDLTETQKAELHESMVQANLLLKPLAHKMFGDRGLRKLRDEVRAGRVKLSASERACVQRVMDNEGLILAGYIRVVAPLVRSFHLSTKQDVDDLWQEAALGIYDAIYSFDGRTEFSTYSYSAVKNRLIRLRKEKLRSLDEDDKRIDPVDKTSEIAKRVLDMLDVIESCPLDVNERSLIEYCLKDGESGWQSRWAHQVQKSKQWANIVYKSAKAKIAKAAA
jgi:RNA polymerase sigma factor (sigma-70 family)